MGNLVEPFIRNIYARRDFRLVTAFEQVDMKATEDRLVRFGSEADYNSMLELGLFVECINNLPSQPIVNPITLLPQRAEDMPIPLASVPAAVQAEQDVEPLVEAEVITQQNDDILCPKCNCSMILSVDTLDPENIYDVMYCPGCQYSYRTGNVPADHVSEPSEVTPAARPTENIVSELPKAPRVMSRCACGKVKSAAAPMCKTCMAEANDGS